MPQGVAPAYLGSASQGLTQGQQPPAAVAAAADMYAAPRSLEDIELYTIRQAVDAAGGNISVAAKTLGISRNTIYRKLRWNQSR